MRSTLLLVALFGMVALAAAQSVTLTTTGSTYTDAACTAGGADFTASVTGTTGGGAGTQTCSVAGSRWVQAFCVPQNYGGSGVSASYSAVFYSASTCASATALGSASGDLSGACTVISSITPAAYVKVTGCSSAAQISVSALLIAALAFFAVRINKML